MGSREQPWIQPFNTQGSSDRQVFISSEPFQSHQSVVPPSATHGLPSPSHHYSAPYQGPEVPRRLYSDGYYPQSTGQPPVASYPQPPVGLPTQEYAADRRQESAVPTYYTTTTSQGQAPISPVTPSSASYQTAASSYPPSTDLTNHALPRAFHPYSPSSAPPPYFNRPSIVQESRGGRLSNYDPPGVYSASSYYHEPDAQYIPPPMPQASRRSLLAFSTANSSAVEDWFPSPSTTDSVRQDPPSAYQAEPQLQAPLPRPSTHLSYFRPSSPNRSSGESEPPTYNQGDGSRSSEEIDDHVQDTPLSATTSPPQKPKRRRADAAQLRVLNEVYSRTAFPSTEERVSLAQRLGMTPRQVQIWFQNRRQNAKAGRGPPVPGSSQPSLSPDVPTPYFVKDESFEPEDTYHHPFYQGVQANMKRDYD